MGQTGFARECYPVQGKRSLAVVDLEVARLRETWGAFPDGNPLLPGGFLACVEAFALLAVPEFPQPLREECHL
jgi:hypothetical protein